MIILFFFTNFFSEEINSIFSKFSFQDYGNVYVENINTFHNDLLILFGFILTYLFYIMLKFISNKLKTYKFLIKDLNFFLLLIFNKKNEVWFLTFFFFDMSSSSISEILYNVWLCVSISGVIYIAGDYLYKDIKMWSDFDSGRTAKRQLEADLRKIAKWEQAQRKKKNKRKRAFNRVRKTLKQKKLKKNKFFYVLV